MRLTEPLISLVFAVSIAAPAIGADTEGAFDLRPGRTERISVSSKGAQASGNSGQACSSMEGPSMSDDGRFVAFSSNAGDLDPRDANKSLLSDVFVRDRKTGKTVLVSLTSKGVVPPLPDLGGLIGCRVWNHHAAISAGGRFVAFVSPDPLLAPDRPDGVFEDVFVHDLKKGRTELVSVDTPVAVGENGVSISGDGRFVAFDGQPPGCGLDDADAEQILLGCNDQVFVRDRRTGKTRLVSTGPGGKRGDGHSRFSSISDDGRYVTFNSLAGNLVENDLNLGCLFSRTPSCPDVFLHDLKTKKTELISITSGGQLGNEGSFGASWSKGQTVTPGGRFVVFDSGASNLVPNHRACCGGLFVRDRKTDRTEKVSISSEGIPFGGGGVQASISDNGRYVFFHGGAGLNQTDQAYGNCQGILRRPEDRPNRSGSLLGLSGGRSGSAGFDGNRHRWPGPPLRIRK